MLHLPGPATDLRPLAGPDPFPVRFPVVVLVASAGGIDALNRVLTPLPADLPAAVVILLHQDPSRPNQLVPILRRHTALPVDVVTRDTEMRPGHVLVIPPGQHLLVTSEARLGLIETGSLPPARPSADLLLATLAVTCGARALAVILTGLGHDGQAGVRAIAHCGGTVLAQDNTTAKFDAMPAAAIATGHVQHVLALDDIGAAILHHVHRS
ncbi:chemotaxis protein CheB [Actinoplanes sp. Pm04-4]|uniref:protein-glutamate methylesterase n=1 Tax=Paractinoplanes pyxinae TaxID=2997416 RepID=A0ABT4B536_9ACTN|nr:chemotaxis protein CheB [Actinoplanes pyxinae]MCY1141609.1 chemotaxis protein CheB [Actinoplanes pyxinae]